MNWTHKYSIIKKHAFLINIDQRFMKINLTTTTHITKHNYL